MASSRFACKLFYLAKCLPVSTRQAAPATIKAEAVAAGKPAESVLSERDFQKLRTFAWAAQQVSAEEGGCGLRYSGRGRYRYLRRGGSHFPFGGIDMLNSFFPDKTLRSMIETMDRFFKQSFGQYRSGLRPLGSTIRQRAPWDFAETEDAFQMRLDLPGLSKEEVKVFVEDGSLVIKGESIQEAGNVWDEAAGQAQAQWKLRSQASSSNYSTSIILPDNANAEEIRAELKNGVLSVTIPKIVEVEPKKNIINVKMD